MKDNKFIHETIQRFGDGLSKALAEGSDTFSFEFDSHDLPGMQKSVDQNHVSTPMTLVVLLRPKALADPMLAVMQEAREKMLEEAAKALTQS